MNRYERERRVCSVSGQEFWIEPEDFAFYEKIGVPAPTLCPLERQRRRSTWRNERTFYRGTCAATGKNIVTLYSSDKLHVVYDQKYWWSDAWDPMDFGRDYDFDRSFFDQFKELQLVVPRMNLFNRNCVNSEYNNHSGYSKNCYMNTVVFYSENVMYSNIIYPGKECVDCYRIEYGSNERLYECVLCHRCYHCQFCYLVDDSADCFYGFDLKNCSNCFLCYNLRNASYCILNQQYTKDEYKTKLAEYDLGSYAVRQKLYQQWLGIMQHTAVHQATIMENCHDCTGNQLHNSKNAHDCYEGTDVEDCKYLYVGKELKGSYDLYHTGVGSELHYECHAVMAGYKNTCCNVCYDNSEISYCDLCFDCENLFGCIGLRKKKYCILNQQYTDQEYCDLKPRIVEHMHSTGEYGEFFPVDLSPFAYNETQANVYMRMDKVEAQERGYNWQDNLPGTFDQETVSPEQILDHIDDIDDTITELILRCVQSGRNYNIVPDELEFYRREHIPVPRLHLDERYERRRLIRPERQLYERRSDLSDNPVLSVYNQDRPEKIYNKEEYQQEII